MLRGMPNSWIFSKASFHGSFNRRVINNEVKADFWRGWSCLAVENHRAFWLGKTQMSWMEPFQSCLEPRFGLPKYSRGTELQRSSSNWSTHDFGNLHFLTKQTFEERVPVAFCLASFFSTKTSWFYQLQVKKLLSPGISPFGSVGRRRTWLASNDHHLPEEAAHGKGLEKRRAFGELKGHRLRKRAHFLFFDIFFVFFCSFIFLVFGFFPFSFLGYRNVIFFWMEPSGL